MTRLATLLVLAGGAAASEPPLPRHIPAATAQPPSADIVFATASELARRIRGGELSSTEVVRAFVAQISRENGRYNAIVLLDAEGALARAAEADAARARGESWGPLHGVPVTIKDTFETQGLRSTAGDPALAGHLPAHDATLVALVKGAGAIVLGKTNAATLAMDMQTDNALFGRTVNPWDTGRTPGGSSGGCVTALATGMTPLSFGSDLAGSIRLPSSYTGVYGLKPTFGTVSMKGHIPPLPGEVSGIRRAMAVAGPMARSIEDLELALGILARPHASDARVQPLRSATGVPRQLSALRVAYMRELGGVPVGDEVTRSLEAFVARLREAGASVVEAQPQRLSYQRSWETWGALVGMQGGYDRSSLARWVGRLVAGNQVAHIAHQRRILDPISLPAYMRALDEQDAQIDALDEFLSDYDVWIVPTAPTPAIEHTRPSSSHGVFNVYDASFAVNGTQLPYYTLTQAYTTLFAVTESPVVALPIGRTAAGLPIGVQVVGRRFDDLRLLRATALLASVVEPLRYPLDTRGAR